MKWAYGVTTVASRLKHLLPKTLSSLANAGFDNPRLFIDGAKENTAYAHLGLETTCHYPVLRTVGNWVLGLVELYLREPKADRYAIFQDDLICCKSLKEYLTLCEFPEKGYWNLYTFPENEALTPQDHTGWYPSNQKGKGALGLVFSQEGVQKLLRHQILFHKPQDSIRGHKVLDGVVSEVFHELGWAEYVHNPSLVQHCAQYQSSIGKKVHPLAKSFPGEEFNCLQLLPKRDIQDPQFNQWEHELQSLYKARAEDEERLKEQTDPRQIKHFQNLVNRYDIRIRHHLRNTQARK